MRNQDQNTVRLPRQLLQQLGIHDDHDTKSRIKRTGPAARKEQRRASRVQKKNKHAPIAVPLKLSKTSMSKTIQAQTLLTRAQSLDKPLPQRNALNSILKNPKSFLSSKSDFQRREPSLSLPSTFEPSKFSRGVRDRLAADDAEITALEKALGLKGKRKTPKPLEGGDFDTLLDDLGETEGADDVRLGKRKRDEEEAWLKNKRQKAQGERRTDSPDDSEENFSDSSSGNKEMGSFQSGSDDNEGSEAESLANVTRRVQAKSGQLIRENPYIAPSFPGQHVASAKYLPPSRRGLASDGEDLSRIRRQIQGCLNRLSEASLIPILGDIEGMFRDNPRQHVSTTLLDLLIGLLCDLTSLQDTFIILHAGFIAAVYKVIGTEFGAQAVQKIDMEFKRYYNVESDDATEGKRLTNLVSLLAELYNFGVIGSGLIYDFIRIFLKNLSETNTELLLKIIRNSGPQLRHDDPSALKDIVLHLQSSVAKSGEENLSVRTKFMIETINNLKNNRMKTGIVASTITSEHTIRMKKTLGTLNMRSIKASEPLRIGLKDLRDTEKRGKWWLVGASYRDENYDTEMRPSQAEIHSTRGIQEDKQIPTNGVPDLAHLARQQRMNTDVRRSIFVAIMSATDYRDAHLRLMKLRLKKCQELEIPKVLIHCAGAEASYNPFYTLISRRLCSDRKMKMAFQFSLWDLFKKMGDGIDDEEDDDEQKLEVRSVVNLAKMFGSLIADGGLGIGVLKALNLAVLPPQTSVFVEILLITTILQSQQGTKDRRDEKPLMQIFLRSKDTPDLARGLHYVLKKVVSKTDIAGGKQETETVRWGCRKARDMLQACVASVVVDT